MPCHGNAEEHCCWLAGKVCKYLEENTVPDRRWACGLRRRYGSWEDAVASPEYQTDIEPHFGPKGISCATWPDANPGTKCTACGYGCD